jgi:transposase InsO family protein
MDFVTGLPTVNGLDSIWVVTDRLTKMRHFVACNQNVSAEDLADLFLPHVWKYHGLPDDIFSDRGPQFASRFWKHLCARLKITPKLSSAFHPQTDGQTERVNGIMEQYLRAYVTYQQDNWPTLLPLAEFAGNLLSSEATGVSPFFANYGFDPRIDFDLNDLPGPQPAEAQAYDVARHFANLHEFLRTELLHAQHRYQEGADRRRTPAPRFDEGDLVWLKAQNIRTERPSRKLDHRRLGPFKITKVVSPHAYELDLPASMRVHPVFSVSLLDPAADDPIPGQRNPPPPPVIVDEDEEYEVEEILDSKMLRRRLRYKVKWTGYDHPTWEPAEFINKASAVDEFHRRYPDKPGPLPEDPE